VIVTAMSKKRSPGCSGKNRGVTPSLAAPGVTHPSDATVGTDHRIARPSFRVSFAPCILLRQTAVVRVLPKFLVCHVNS